MLLERFKMLQLSNYILIEWFDCLLCDTVQEQKLIYIIHIDNKAWM